MPAPSAFRQRRAQLLAEILLGAVVSAALWCAIASTGRPPAMGLGWFWTCLSLEAIALPVALASVAFLRATRWAFRVIVPDARKRAFSMSVLALWAASSAVGLRIFATVLHAATHHRGLGGTTFAIVGLIAVAAAGLVVLRVCQLFRPWLARQAVAWSISILCIGVVLLVARSATSSPVGTDPPTVAVASWYVTLLATITVLSAQIPLPAWSAKMAAPLLSGVFVLLVAAGLATSRHVAYPMKDPSSSSRVFELLHLVMSPALASAKTEPSSPPPATSGPSPIPARSASARPTMQAPASITAGRTNDETGDRKPDIILVSLDAVRADHIGVYGYKRPTSNQLDALASKGAVFQNAYASGPETRTAIPAVVVGKFLEQCDRDSRPWPTLLETEETVAERLQKAGYTTGAVASFQWLSKERGFGQGFDTYDEGPFRKVHPERWSTSAHAIAQALHTYDELAGKGKPVFLWVHLFDAHQKYLPHPEHEFGTTEIDLYDGEVAHQDAELGKLIEHVQAGSRGKNTVWVVHGTHGEALGEHGLHGHPVAGYEELIRVPLVVRIPNLDGRRVDTAVSTIRIVPTILDVAGVTAETLPGRSLRPMVAGSSTGEDAQDDILVSSAGLQAAHESIRVWISRPHKLVVTTTKDKERAMLFNLGTDPTEKNNLAEEKQEEVVRMRRALELSLTGQTGRKAASRQP